MTAAQDPFYLVKEEVQGSVNKAQSDLKKWEQLSISSQERFQLGKNLIAACQSIDRQVDELDRAIAVGERDPARYGLDSAEITLRKKWTSSTRNQISVIKKTVQETENKRVELTMLPVNSSKARPNYALAHDDEDFYVSESDKQALIMRLTITRSGASKMNRERVASFFPLLVCKRTEMQLLMGTTCLKFLAFSYFREQDQDLDELSANVERLGGVGLTIHDELISQERLIDELGQEMENTANRLDFVQKKVAHVIKKAGAKGQIMMIIFLVILLMVLILLVFS